VRTCSVLPTVPPSASQHSENVKNGDQIVASLPQLGGVCRRRFHSRLYEALVSRGIAKAGSREPYTETTDY